jgi:hypothetical protein
MPEPYIQKFKFSQGEVESVVMDKEDFDAVVELISSRLPSYLSPTQAQEAVKNGITPGFIRNEETEFIFENHNLQSGLVSFIARGYASKAMSTHLAQWAEREADELYSPEDILRNALFALLSHACRSEFKEVRPDMVEKLLEYKFYGVPQPISNIKNREAKLAAMKYVINRHCNMKFENDWERQCLELLLVFELSGVALPICKMTKEEAIKEILTFYQGCS